jgi:hypothetical protein
VVSGSRKIAFVDFLAFSPECVWRSPSGIVFRQTHGELRVRGNAMALGVCGCEAPLPVISVRAAMLGGSIYKE